MKIPFIGTLIGSLPCVHCWHRHYENHPFIKSHGPYVDAPDVELIERRGIDRCCHCGKTNLSSSAIGGPGLPPMPPPLRDPR